ncbi:MAG: hypothetical protein HZA12_04555 [Nitrospirae bacterium]|nr:hypothetical protein [Nitrospirota bacterium]
MKRILWFFILFIFSLGIFQYALAQPNELTLLKKINVAASVDNTRIEIRFNGAPLQEKIHYREDSLQIEFPDSFISPAKQSYKVEDDIVKNIVAYQFDDTTVRVRLFTYGKSENLRDKIRFSRDINKVIIVYNQETGTPDKETRVSLRDTKGDGKGFSDKTGMSPGSQNGMKITPPLNPLPQGEGRYERLPIIPPP